MSVFDPNGTAMPASWESRRRQQAYLDRLRRRLRWNLLFAYATPLLLLAVCFHFQYGETLRARVENHLVSIAEERRHTVDLLLGERLANLRGALRSPAWTIPPPEDAKGTLLASLRDDSPSFVDVGLSDEGNREIEGMTPGAFAEKLADWSRWIEACRDGAGPR